MAVTREQFEAGMTYDAYKAQMTRNKEQVEQNEKDLQLKPDDVQAIRSLHSPLNVLALAEDWCGDVVARRGDADYPGASSAGLQSHAIRPA